MATWKGVKTGASKKVASQQLPEHDDAKMRGSTPEHDRLHGGESEERLG